MTPAKFPEANVLLGKEQPRYLTLPAHRWNHDDAGTFTVCWRLSWRERLKLLFTGLLWHESLTFGDKFQPQRLGLEKPDLSPGAGRDKALFFFHRRTAAAGKPAPDKAVFEKEWKAALELYQEQRAKVAAYDDRQRLGTAIKRLAGRVARAKPINGSRRQRPRSMSPSPRYTKGRTGEQKRSEMSEANEINGTLTDADESRIT